MELLRIFTVIIGVLCNIGMTALVIHLFFQLRKVKENQKFLMQTTAKIYATTSAIKLQASFDQIGEMQKILQKLVKDENYEEAEKLQSLIEHSLKDAFGALEAFKETFGEDIAATVVTVQAKKP